MCMILPSPVPFFQGCLSVCLLGFQLSFISVSNWKSAKANQSTLPSQVLFRKQNNPNHARMHICIYIYIHMQTNKVQFSWDLFSFWFGLAGWSGVEWGLKKRYGRCKYSTSRWDLLKVPDKYSYAQNRYMECPFFGGGGRGERGG